MAVVAVANTSTYIQGGIEYDAYVSGSNIVVNVRLYFRRTNAWSGQTYSSSVGEYICISGDPDNYNYSQTGSITVAGGQQDVWQGAFFSASRTFDSSRGGNTIYVGWKTNDNVSSYFTGSNNVQITLPTVNTPPTGLSASNVVRGIEDFTATVSVTGWGVGSGTKYRELQVWTLGMTEPRRYQPSYGDSLSGNITVGNSSNGSLTIRGNTMYTLGVYASNGQANTGSISLGGYTTRAYAPTVSVGQLTDTTAAVSYTLQSDGGQYAKNVQYSLDGGATWATGATINTGSATTGSFTITGLTPNTSYTMKTRVSTSAGETDGADVTFKTYPSYEPHGDFYGSVNDAAKQINGFYGSVESQGTRVSKNINKLYGSVEGESKLIHQSFGHYEYPKVPKYGIVYYKTNASDPDSEIKSVELESQAEFGSLSNSSFSWTATVGGGTVTVSNMSSNVIVGVTIGSEITSIGNYFLDRCTSFNQPLTIPSNITAIPAYFLSGCTSFNQPLTIPDSVLSISYYFLTSCSAFNQPLTLPDSITSIGTGFLSLCYAFNQSLTLPANLTSIGSQFINGCDNMTGTVNVGSLNATIANSNEYTFSSSSATMPCYTTGITIAGANRAAWISRFPNSSSYPYRKLVDAGY